MRFRERIPVPPRLFLGLCIFVLASTLRILPAAAACSTSGTTTSCTTNNPNPSTATIGNGPNTASGASVTLQPGAQISAGNANAISLGDNATINLGANSLVQNSATSGSGTNGNGLWNTGKNTIEFGSFGNLTIGTGAVVQSLGTSNNAEAINVMGIGNTITNYGTITSRSGAAIWFEDKTTGGTNTVDNYGTITTSLGANTNVIGNSASGNVNFINESGAVVNGSLSFAGGNDTLTLFPNSVITGGFNGGGGTNTLILNGTAGSSDTLPGNISNFQTLTKTGLGSWALSGAVGNNGGAALRVEVQAGTLSLTGNNSNFNGNILVDAAGVLEARAQSLPPTVTDNGIVRFTQDTSGTYAGAISGTGSVEKTLGATLTLTGNNTYAGGTTINLGEIVISSDANLGAASGGLILNGGGLGTATNVTVSRTATLGPLGGTFDTMAGTLTANGVVSGEGALTKIGAGTLALTAANSYTGNTIINQGTVQVSSDANLGDPASMLQFNGGTLATTADITTARSATLGDTGGTLQTAAGTTLTDSGVFSGTGMLTKTGAGTLALTGINTQTGGTAINGGVMIVTNDNQLGASSAPLQFDGGTLVAGPGLATRPTIINSGGATVQLDGDPLDPAQYLTVSGPDTGPGGLTKTGTGTLIYSGDNSYTGPTTVAGGGYFINGNSSAQTGTITAQSGTRVGGTGIIGGSVTIQDGATIAPGSAPLTPATLTINGDLNLSPNSILFYNMVQPTSSGSPLNDLLNVHGNLVLDGTFNVLDQGQTLGPGVYRIINYDGTLTDNGLTIGNFMSDPSTISGPLPNFIVQTAIPGQVNLINANGLDLNYWDGDAGPKSDGAIDGGNGTWRVAQPASTSNWTGSDGAVNAPWNNGQFAIFTGSPGTVTVNNTGGNVAAAGMQFMVDGYVVNGDPITLQPAATAGFATNITVGDGSSAGVNYTATINAVLSGTAILVKDGIGTLVLNGVNTFIGGTTIQSGVLQISADNNLGAAGNLVNISNGATLRTTTSFATGRTILLDGSGTIETMAGTQFSISGAIANATADPSALVKAGDGTLVLTAANTYSGGTTISGGTLQIGSSGTTGSITGNVANGGTLAFNRTDAITFGGIISDYNYTDAGGNPVIAPGKLLQTGSGTLILTADNTYSGGTTISTGTLQIGDGSADGSIVGDVADNGALAFNRSDTISFGGAISGSGTVTQAGGGTTILTGVNSYTGATSVNNGSLYVNGDQSVATGVTNVVSAATLGGTGTIGGDVSIGSGATLAPGGNTLAPGTLTIKGNLALDAASTLAYSFGQANVVGGPFNDLTKVQGNLALGGTLNVTLSPGGSFDPGVYRVFDYGGTLSGSLALGSVPAGTFLVQTAVDKQINLVNATGLSLNYWDGDAGPKNDNSINGGDGTWRVAGSSSTFNWTEQDGTTNAVWDNSGAFAIFQATPGDVTVDNENGQVQASGMQFASGGYVLDGDALELVGAPNSIIRVGDGASDGAAYTATINVVLSGNTVLEKADLGTLILTAANTYTGGTEIDGGMLQISSDANLGAAGTGITLDQGTLATTADMTTSRPVTLNAGGGSFQPAASTTLELDGPIGGAGALIKSGAGTVVITTDAGNTGGTTIAAGTLQIGNGGTTGSITGNVANGGTLAFNRTDTVTFAGAISDNGAASGKLVQAGTGTVILTGDSTFTGGTTVAAGTLQLGNGGTTGSITGDIVDNGTLVVNRSDTVTINGLVSGSGDFVQAGTGTTILAIITPDGHGETYAGKTIIEQGTLQIGTGGAGGGLASTDIINDSVFISSIHASFPWAGSVSGTGSVIIDQGTGNTLTVLGAHTYTGGTTLASGIVQIGDGGTAGTLLGDIANFGTIIVNHSDDLILTNVMTGTGNAIKEGPDTITLVGDSTYTGGTTINAGTLVLGNGGTMGSILGNIIDNAALVFNHSNSLLLNSPITGTGTLTQAGTGTVVLGADNTYSGGTTVSAGTLQIGNGDIHGSVTGDIVDNAILSFSRSDTYTFSGNVSGTGQLVQVGPGTLILTGSNTYTGGTAIEGGVLQISNDANLGAGPSALHIGGATLAITADITNTSTRETVLEQLGGTFLVPAGLTLTNPGLIDGAGGFTLAGGGTMILSGDNSYAGPTNVAAGTLRVNGDQSAATGLMTVASGGTLGGDGIVGGDTVIADGSTLAPGNSPGTITINGNLTLNPGSILSYDFGQASVVGGPLNDHTIVGGNLLLDGTINVVTPPGGSFDPGIYRIISYAGTLTNNGLDIGTIPSPDFFVQTSVANQVNLINTAGLTLNYWDGAAGPKNDGAIQGGDGVWQSSAGNDNWTDANGTVNAPFTNAAFAVFEGAGGRVTVDAALGAINVSGMQFATDGYVVQGDAINLAGSSLSPDATVIRVGDGTAESAALTTTINSVLAGGTSLVKADLGTLVLTAANTYTGGTVIEGGVLQISNDNNLGVSGAGLTLDGGILATTASFTIARPTMLGAPGGGFQPAAGTQLTETSDISGTGPLLMTGDGTLILTGANTYIGGTTISAGTLQLGGGGTSGGIAGDVTDNGTLAFDRSDMVIFDSVISGTGNVAQTGSGTTVLTANESYAGSTAVSAGTLAVGDAAHMTAALSGGGAVTVAGGATFGGYGSIAGPVTNNGALAVADAVPAFAGQGSGSFTIIGTLTNAGMAKLGGAGVGNQLSVSSYVGQNGQIAMNTVLDGDGSPHDQLVINGGTAIGQSAIAVTNLGGLGGATPGNGIQLVSAQNGATTAGDAFALSNRVVAGPYQYTLFRGSRDSSGPQSWYLRSELANPPVMPPEQPGPPEPPIPPPPPGEPAPPPGETPPPPVTPDYRPEVSLYTALPSMILNYGTTLVGSLHKRVGEEGLPTGEDGTVFGPTGAWLRVIGDDGHWDAEEGGIYRNGPSFRDDTLAVQGGVDLYRNRQDGNRDFAGLTVSYGHTHGSVENFDATIAGSDRFDATSLGAYWTHFGPSGWYVDGVVQGTWYNAAAISNYDTGLTTRGSGVTLSAEGGYPIPLDDNWSLEPQAQLIYQMIGLDEASDIAAQVRFRDLQSLTGRIGERAARTWMTEDNRKITGWLLLNVWNEFLSDAKTEFSSDEGFLPFHSDLTGPWGEAGLGVYAEIADSFSAYATASYQKGFDHGMRTFGGNIGLRFNP